MEVYDIDNDVGKMLAICRPYVGHMSAVDVGPNIPLWDFISQHLYIYLFLVVHMYINLDSYNVSLTSARSDDVSYFGQGLLDTL